jgi:hypothetical protein
VLFALILASWRVFRGQASAASPAQAAPAPVPVPTPAPPPVPLFSASGWDSPAANASQDDVDLEAMLAKRGMHVFSFSARVLLAILESSQASLPSVKPAALAPVTEGQEPILATAKPHCFPGFYLEIADEPPKRTKDLDLEEQLEKLDVGGAPDEEAAEGTWTDEKCISTLQQLAELVSADTKSKKIEPSISFTSISSAPQSNACAISCADSRAGRCRPPFRRLLGAAAEQLGVWLGPYRAPLLCRAGYLHALANACLRSLRAAADATHAVPDGFERRRRPGFWHCGCLCVFKKLRWLRLHARACGLCSYAC